MIIETQYFFFVRASLLEVGRIRFPVLNIMGMMKLLSQYYSELLVIFVLLLASFSYEVDDKYVRKITFSIKEM